jgi:hypothetical protein
VRPFIARCIRTARASASLLAATTLAIGAGDVAGPVLPHRRAVSLARKSSAVAAVGGDGVDHAAAVDEQQLVESLAQLARLGVPEQQRVTDLNATEGGCRTGVCTSPAPSLAISVQPAAAKAAAGVLARPGRKPSSRRPSR